MRYCFIINPNSRSQRGRAIWEEVQKELEKSQIKYEIYLTEEKMRQRSQRCLRLTRKKRLWSFWAETER